jgi:hypothetical protein
MKNLILFIAVLGCIILSNYDFALSQEAKAKNSLQLTLSGRVQLQHFFNNRLKSSDSLTFHGFRIRRGRLQVDAKVTSFFSAKIQIEARDNSPRLKDAEGKLKLFNKYYFRFGQFKVPVWREEFMRSSGDLILVERSATSTFLEINLLSARQIGIEFGGQVSRHWSFLFNYSNGSGEGNSEIEILKIVEDAPLLSRNNGKMYAGRIDFNATKSVKLGLSGAVNYIGNKVDTLDNTGKNTTIAPDFGIYLPLGIDLEGGLAFGSISKSFLEELENQNYVLADITGRWKKMLKKSNDNFGGLSGFEIAAGFSYIETDSNELNQRNAYRLGPALYFGKKSRLQVNAEIVDPAVKGKDIFWRIRSQLTVNL